MNAVWLHKHHDITLLWCACLYVEDACVIKFSYMRRRYFVKMVRI